MVQANWERVFIGPVLRSFRRLAGCHVPSICSLLAMLGSEEVPVLPVWDHFFSGPCCYFFSHAGHSSFFTFRLTSEANFALLLVAQLV